MRESSGDGGFTPILLQGASAVQGLGTASQGKVTCLIGKVKHLIEHRDLTVAHDMLVTSSHLAESFYALNHAALFPGSGWAEHLSK